jgi:polar amino acid transport system ATP-binding protein
MITIDDLTKRFDGRLVLDGVTTAFEHGKVTAVLGASGCGKSTLLRCINGLETFDRGTIRVGELALGPSTLHRIRLAVGMVFQHYALFAHMSALANVMEAPVHVRGLSPPDARARALHLLERVGLAHRRDALPHELSGGEQQRVAIARALAMDPKALLLDEPTAALDPERKEEVIRVLETLAGDGTTMVIVTHEPALVRGVADRTLTLVGGRVAADDAPAQTPAPA